MPPADGSITYQTAPECPFCEGDNIDDGGFCLRCKERVCVLPYEPRPAIPDDLRQYMDVLLARPVSKLTFDQGVEAEQFDAEGLEPTEAELCRWESTL